MSQQKKNKIPLITPPTPTQKSTRKKRNQYFLEALKKAPIPTERRFVFPWSHESESFDFSRYSKTKAGGVLTAQDLMQVQQDLEKSKYYTLDNFFWYFIFYILPWVIFLVYFLASFYYFRQTEAFVIKLEILIGGFLLLLIILLLYMIGKNHFRVKLMKRGKSFKKILRALNRSIFDQKDIIVTVGKYGAYLVFELDFKTSMMEDLEIRLRNEDGSLVMTEAGKSFNGGVNRMRMSKSLFVPDLLSDVYQSKESNGGYKRKKDFNF